MRTDLWRDVGKPRLQKLEEMRDGFGLTCRKCFVTLGPSAQGCSVLEDVLGAIPA